MAKQRKKPSLSDFKAQRFPVQFLRPYGGYNAGEIAGFPKERSDALVSSGVAIAINQSVEEKVEECSDKSAETTF